MEVLQDPAKSYLKKVVLISLKTPASILSENNFEFPILLQECFSTFYFSEKWFLHARNIND